MNESSAITLNDGTTMPQIGLGVWQAKDGNETREAVRVAIETGYRLIDTAAVYQNEQSVGLGIKDSNVDRSDLYITTKLWNSDQAADKVRPALEASLERLGLDYVDLYLIHWPTPARDLYIDTWKEFERLKADGLVRSIGVSNFRIEDLDRLASETSTIPAVNQVELHPYFQQRELRDYGLAHGIKIESWSPLGGAKGNILQDDVLATIATSYAKSAAQIIIRWHIQSGLIVIPKSVNTDRIKQNYDVFDFTLSADHMTAINQLDKGLRSGPNPSSMNIS